jgi:enterochelin esterase-like enzyme
MSRVRWTGRRAPRLLAAGSLALAGAFILVGFVGVEHYGRNYWLYRGFPPPRDPAYVTQTGTEEKLAVTSPALGGRSQQVYVYLPPGYEDHPEQRYPVMYLLHGFPGRPLAFLLTVRAGVVEDELAAKDEAQPMILVMPWGSTGTFTDKEWADGVHAHEGWATFVARDLVRAIDSTYRTLPTAAGRAIAGLSEGGYGALNIALHHPREFRVVESWSGYERAPKIPSIFGAQGQTLADNTPLELLPQVAHALRRAHVFFWFYSGSDDPLDRQNRQFSAELAHAHIPHEYLEFPGGHNWALWRGYAADSLLAAATRLAHG